MKSLFKLLAICLFSISLNACAVATSVIEGEDNSERAAGLESRDFDQAAAKMIKKIAESGNLNKPNGQPYLMILSRVENATMQRIDVTELTDTIREELLSTGKVRITMGNEDAMINQAGQLRNSKEYNQANVRKQGSLAAPELTMSGKITQSEKRLSDGRKRIEYRFVLKVADINTGLSRIEVSERINKIADKNSITW